MPISKPTLNFRWRKATEEELNEEMYPLSTKHAGEYYILEQQHRIETIDGVTFEWKGVPIAENEKK
jgi:hypothetical protein